MRLVDGKVLWRLITGLVGKGGMEGGPEGVDGGGDDDTRDGEEGGEE